MFHRGGPKVAWSQPLFRFPGQPRVGPRLPVSYLGMTPAPESAPSEKRLVSPYAAARDALLQGGEIPSFRIRGRWLPDRLLASAEGLYRMLMHPQTSIK
ncbi:hypothetical protein GCM10010448_61520 [Streptomyces glomeratus]|uniref:Uncharacterized protein n=1 Tax=Streptomyces glomeratus TaxID=284452 RepID=A0ABP6M3C1_9ACTN